MSKRSTHALILSIVAASVVAACDSSTADGDRTAEAQQNLHGTPESGYNLHLEDTLRFTPLQPGANVESGRGFFGISEDLTEIDTTFGLFEGASQAAMGPIFSNGRTCFSCHRGVDFSFGMPAPPLSDTIPSTDPLFTGIDADAQGDPRAADLLEDHGLFKIRPNRFNLSRSDGDAYRELFFWRKSPALVNAAFSHGFLNDGRGRHFFETARGAVFSHTQATDARFDDLFPTPAANDMEAFSKSHFSDPRLADLLSPDAPLFRKLARRPFFTVDVQTRSQRRGKRVFRKNCMSCHNMPNVFANRANVTPLGHDDIDPEFPTHGPGTTRAFNIGVAEQNKHGLEFTRDVGDGTFEPIEIELAGDDGAIVNFEVNMDVGLAATSARLVDVGRFKVPQLRNIRNLGPYFHDNSADTLEEVISYFNSAQYNESADGRRHPIHMTAQQRSDLLEFLLIL